MAHSKQAEKRNRQNKKRQLRNRAKSSRMKSEFKKLMTAVEAGDRSAAEQQLTLALQRIDKAAKTRVIHPNTAARKKSQAMRAFGRLPK